MVTNHGRGLGRTPYCAVGAGAAAGAYQVSGFRHLVNDPANDQRLRVEGAPPGTDLPRTRHLMGVLAGLMAAENQASERLDTVENDNMPSGYTYLLQLVAHDCVHTSTPFWALPNRHVPARNGRTGRLRLDTIYGDGPTGCPFAYEPDDANDTSRSRLRLGRMRNDPMVAEANGELRDIGRLAGPPRGSNGPASRDPNLPWMAQPPLTEALLADPRNDDNALVSQITTLFHMLHNTLLGRISEPAEWLGAMEARFACARAATTMIYRRILRDDLLRRVLHPVVHAHYQSVFESSGANGTLECGPGERGSISVPLEFSHGAFRFAHSMIRPSYRTGVPGVQPLGEALRRTSARAPASMPLDHRWILPWSRFFQIEINGVVSSPNLSLRIRPRYTSTLNDAAWFPPPLPADAAAVPSGGVHANGVALQDLLSAALAGVWSVQPLYESLQRRITELQWPDLLGPSQLSNPEARSLALSEWMTRSRLAAAPSPRDVAALAADPPLPFYVLFEADREHDGRCLGRLGSVIVAEVLYRAMLDDPLPGEDVRASLPQNLASLSQEILGNDALGTVPEIQEMAHLIAFIADENGLRGATPAFV